MAISDFLSRLVRTNTQEQSTMLQPPLQELCSSLKSNQALQASALVGRQVLAFGNRMYLGSKGDVKAAIDVPENSGQIHAFIYSQHADLIRTISLGQPAAGFYPFHWDGYDERKERVLTGIYRLKVVGVFAGEEQVFKTMTAANVDSVSLSRHGEGLKVNLSGLGSVSFDQIRQIFL